MHRLTHEQILEMLRPVPMRYTPRQLKLTPMDRLPDELAARLHHSDVLPFTLPGAPILAGAIDAEEVAVMRREAIRAYGFEKARREAVRSLPVGEEPRYRITAVSSAALNGLGTLPS